MDASIYTKTVQWSPGGLATWESGAPAGHADAPTCRRAHLPTRSPADVPTCRRAPLPPLARCRRLRPAAACALLSPAQNQRFRLNCRAKTTFSFELSAKPPLGPPGVQNGLLLAPKTVSGQASWRPHWIGLLESKTASGRLFCCPNSRRPRRPLDRPPGVQISICTHLLAAKSAPGALRFSVVIRVSVTAVFTDGRQKNFAAFAACSLRQVGLRRLRFSVGSTVLA
jgi:hypothetical protein